MRTKIWGLGLLLGLIAGCGGGEDPDGGAGDAAATCTSDEVCDDGAFCNGVERCAPDDPAADAIGCVRGTDPCLAGQRCDEAAGSCVSNCAVVADADGDGVDAIACGGADCDDTNPNRFPGNVEVCDASDVDEDCDPTTFGDRDADGDGFVDALCCNEDAEGARRCGDDCSDQRRDMRPGFAETCDRLDNDCDGAVDESVSVDGFADEDRDLHGDPSMPMTACPDTPGFSVVDDDCDDADPDIHGAQLEICDRKDNDCDGMTDEAPASVTWYADEDDDGFGSADGATVVSCDPIPDYSLRSSDCDDNDRQVNPAARELCNALDDDCDGRPDFMIAPGDFEDDDGDGYADATCGGNDCDDSNGAVHPGAVELCDGIDNDCDGIADGADANALWYLDLDNDGFGDASDTPIEDCDPQPGRVPRGGDCDDSNAAINPSVADRCDGNDTDCDGATDEDAVRYAYYIDSDGDGFGESAGSVVFACLDVSGRARNPGDCDDSNDTVYPEAPELCDLVDNDCDGDTDEDAPTTWYPDTDGDGHGVPEGAIETCSPPGNYADVSDDCDDANGARFPGNPESCDVTDNDCDGTVDEGADAACEVGRGTGMCNAGLCEVASCDTGWDDCDGSFASGCEVNVTANPAHCGSCGAGCVLGDTCGRTTSGTCDDSSITFVTMGEFNAYVIRSTGTLIGWGENTRGQIGIGGTADVIQPQASLNDVRSISAGSDHVCVITAARTVRCWGFNSRGQLGVGDATQRSGPAEPVIGLTDARQVGVGNEHTCALKMDGTVWCWGDQQFGQLGDGVFNSSGARLEPNQVPGITDALELYVGRYHSCVRRPLGGGGNRIQCWGRNDLGQLGTGLSGDANNVASPTDVVGLVGDPVAFSNGYADRTCVRLSTGTMRCWGRNGGGATANGSSSTSAGEPSPQTATIMGGAEATGIVEICSGIFSTCVLRDIGTPGAYQAWCTGFDDFGQLGDGVDSNDPVSRLQPVVSETGTGTLDNATHIMCGNHTVCVSRTDDSVYCWGGDWDYGTVGDGPGSPGCGRGSSNRCSSTPVRALGL